MNRKRGVSVFEAENTEKMHKKRPRIIGSSQHLDFASLFSNNVVSERERHDPREDEEIKNKEIDTVPERVSEDSYEDLTILDENVDLETPMMNYCKPTKHLGDKNEGIAGMVKSSNSISNTPSLFTQMEEGRNSVAIEIGYEEDKDIVDDPLSVRIH